MKSWTTARRTIPGLLGALCLALPAFSQLTVIGVPWAPTDLSPAGDLAGRFAGGTPLVMGWSQFLSGGGLLLKPLATGFVVCIDPVVGAAPPPCSRANADYFETIAAPTMALTRSGSRFTFIPRSLSNAELDRPLRLTVGACSAPAERNCSYSTVNAWYSTFNPSSDGVQPALASNDTVWKLDVRAMNDADSPAPKFGGSVELFEVLFRGMPGRTCQKNADDPSVVGDPSLVLLDVRGGRTPMPMVSRDAFGAYNGPPVAGIFRLGGFTTSQTFVTGNPALSAHVTTSTGIKTLEFAITKDPLVQKTFVAIASLDTANVIHEFNEGDNVVARCLVR